MSNERPWLLGGMLLAIGPLAIPFVYFAHAQGWVMLTKPFNEAYSVIILPLALAVCAYRVGHEFSRLFLLLGGFAFTAWIREIHFDWAHHGVYLMLLVLIGLAVWWRTELRAEAPPNFRAWFVATMAVYFLSVLVARRALRDVLPNEEDINTPLEEFLESLAHTMLFLTALVGIHAPRLGRRASEAAGSTAHTPHRPGSAPAEALPRRPA